MRGQKHPARRWTSGWDQPMLWSRRRRHGDIVASHQVPWRSPSARKPESSANLHQDTQGHLSSKSRQSSSQLRHSRVTPSHGTPPECLKPTSIPIPGSEPPPPLFRTTGPGTHDTAGSKCRQTNTLPTVLDRVYETDLCHRPTSESSGATVLHRDPSWKHGWIPNFLPKKREIRLILLFDSVCDPQEGPLNPWWESQRSIKPLVPRFDT